MIHMFLPGPGGPCNRPQPPRFQPHFLSTSIPNSNKNNSSIRNYIKRINLLGQQRQLISSPQADRNTLIKQNNPRAQMLPLRDWPKDSAAFECSKFEQLGPAGWTIFYPPLNLQIYL